MDSSFEALLEKAREKRVRPIIFLFPSSLFPRPRPNVASMMMDDDSEEEEEEEEEEGECVFLPRRCVKRKEHDDDDANVAHVEDIVY